MANHSALIAQAVRDHLGNCDVSYLGVTKRGKFNESAVGQGDGNRITGYLHGLTVVESDFPTLQGEDTVELVLDGNPNKGGFYIVRELRRANGSLKMLLSRS